MGSRRRRQGDVLLDPPGNPYDRAAVAQVPPDLTLDTGRDVGGELLRALRVTAVDGADQPDGPDLNEILEALAPAREAAGNVPDERQVLFDQAAPHGCISILESRHGCRIASGALHLARSIGCFAR